MDALSLIGWVPENSFPIHDLLRAPDSPTVATASMVNVSKAQSSDITIVTAEGDRVTLSSSRSSELSFATYNSTAKPATPLALQKRSSAQARNSPLPSREI